MTAPNDLARQLVEHPRWTHADGIHSTRVEYAPGRRRVHVAHRGGWVQLSGSLGGPEPVVDINHPATKGWLLHMLREATGDPGLHVAVMMPLGTQPGGWAVYSTRPLPARPGSTEGEALAAALLAVWGAS